MESVAEQASDAAPAEALDLLIEQIDYKSIALLSAAHLSDDVNQGVVPAMLPFFIAANHLTYAAAAGLVLAQTLSSSVAQPFFGWLADRQPSPWLIPVGLSLAGIGVALAGLAPSYGLIFAAIAMSGLGISAFHPEATRRVRYLSGTRQATAMSLFTVGGMAGFAVGPLLITPTMIALGTRGAIVMALPVMVMAAVITYQMPRLTAIPTLHGVHGSQHAPETMEHWLNFARLTAVVMCRSIVFFGLNTFVPLYWTGVLHGSKSGAGLALTTLLASVTIGTVIGGRMADRFGRRIVVVLSLASIAPLLFVFLESHGMVSTIAFLVPLGIVLAAPASVMVVMGQEYLPNRVGLAAGVTLGLSMTVGGLFMPLFGSIADHHGLGTAMKLLAIVPVLAFAMSLTLRESSEAHARKLFA